VAALVAVATLLSLEAYARIGYHAPGEMVARARAAAAEMRADTVDVSLYGTCLGEQTLDTRLLGGVLGEGGRVHNLSSTGSGPLDWYLAQSNLLDPAKLDAIVILYVMGDLYRAPSPWQSQAMDLARWSDVPDIARWSCATLACQAEFYLRRASYFYRYRAYFGNWAWWMAGARSLSRDPPEGKPPGGGRSAAEEAALHYLGRLVTQSHAAGIPVLFLPMPVSPRSGQARSGDQARIEGWLRGLGGRILPAPELHRGDYEDDVHLNGQGRANFTFAAGELIKQALADLR